MPSTLIFPDGIRLALENEIPGTEQVRSEAWARVESASIAPGFVLRPAAGERFTHFAEINVNAPQIWDVFRDICETLLDPNATFIAAGVEEEPVPVGSADIHSLIAMLEPHHHQLANDGFIQYGLMSDSDETLNEVFVAPEKYFKVWMNDEKAFEQVMARHDIRKASHLEFLNEYPRTTIALPLDSVAFRTVGDMISHFGKKMADSAKCNS